MIAAANRDRRLLARTLVIAVFLLAACSREAAIEQKGIPGGDTIVVFSTIADSVIEPVFDAYSAETGAKLVLISGELRALLEKRLENGHPQPDLFIAGSIAELSQAAEENILRPIRSDLILRRIPAWLRDPEHLWVSITARARTVVYNTQLTSDNELESIADYASLAGASWRGRLCLSSSTVSGNGSLIAMLINDLGVREAQTVVRGWRANLPGSVFADDMKLLLAIAAGQCVVGISDSREIEHFLDIDPDANVASHWFSAEGVIHIDVSGGGVTRHAQNPEGGRSLLEWLTSPEANSLFAARTLEFPANPQATTTAAIADWPGFDPNPVNVAKLGYLLEDAAMLAERARYP